VWAESVFLDGCIDRGNSDCEVAEAQFDVAREAFAGVRNVSWKPSRS
jgi:hypothetical protein